MQRVGSNSYLSIIIDLEKYEYYYQLEDAVYLALMKLAVINNSNFLILKIFFKKCCIA